MAPDVETVIIAREDQTTGATEFQVGSREFVEAFPDLFVEIDNLIVAEPFVVIEWRARGTNLGAIGEHVPTGRASTRRGVGVAEVHDGKITKYRDYFDRVWMLQQIGRDDEPGEGEV